MFKRPYSAPELEELGSFTQLTAAIDPSPRTDFNEDGTTITQGQGSRDVCDPDVDQPDGPFGDCD